MPFLKPEKYAGPRSRRLERMTLKMGLHHAFFTVSGDTYIGEWKDDKKNGHGMLHTRCGLLYEGEFINGKRDGYGVLSMERSSSCAKKNLSDQPTKPCCPKTHIMYVGDYNNGKREGHGICYYTYGAYYEGNWKNGERSGHGRMWFADMSYYEGQWANDMFHGLGILVQSNGNRYEGEWSSNVKHGRGIFYHLDNGQKQQGLWDNGVAFCSTMIDINYRQSGQPSTEYPIPLNKLQDPNDVYSKREDAALRHLKFNMAATSFETGIKELRNIVWGDQMDD